MKTRHEPIPFDDFRAELAAIFARVVRDQEAVIIEDASGRRAVLRPLRPARPIRPLSPPDAATVERSRAGILRTAGAWRDMDTEAIKAGLYERRRTRRPQRGSP